MKEKETKQNRKLNENVVTYLIVTTIVILFSLSLITNYISNNCLQPVYFFISFLIGIVIMTSFLCVIKFGLYENNNGD